jgi:hypothetical protein
VLALLLADALSGCRSCDRAGAVDEGSADVRRPAQALALAALIEAPLWHEEPSSRGFGLPQGCRLELPVWHGETPQPALRFVTDPSTLGELALARPHGDGGAAASGIVEIGRSHVQPLPWAELAAPPIMARAGRGWVAAAAVTAQGSRSALLWRSFSTNAELVSGDELDVIDLRCDGERCALLTTLARAAIAPGATLLIGHAGEPPERWRRVDIAEKPGAPFRPFSILSFDGTGGRALLAMQARRTVSFWQVDGERAERRGALETPHGVFDVVKPGSKANASPVVIAPGSRLGGPCQKDEFPLVISGPGTAEHREVTQVAPDGLVARPLSQGAIVFWIAPVSCRITQRIVVHAMVIDSDGTPVSPPMSVGDATGFAAATRGDEVALWLRTQRGIAYLRGRCAADAASATPATPEAPPTNQ